MWIFPIWGLGAQPGNLYLQKSIVNNLAATSFSTTTSLDPQSPPFKLDALDNLLPSDAQVNFVKIDVEGMEFDVLEGGSKLIRKGRPLVFLECWGWVSNLKLLCWLVENNYRIEKKYDPSYLVMPLPANDYYPENYSKELNWNLMRYMAEGGKVLASEGIVKLQERFNTNPHLSYALAEILVKLDHTEAAQKALRDLENASTTGVVAWYQTIADLSRQIGDDSSKQLALQKAASLSPNDIQITEQLSDDYLANKNEAEASKLISSFIERNPHSAKGHYIKSRLAERAGQMSEALWHANMAVKLDSPDKPSFMVRLADLTRAVDKSPLLALDIINKAIGLGQTSDWAYQVKIAILNSLGRRFSANLLNIYLRVRAIPRQHK